MSTHLSTSPLAAALRAGGFVGRLVEPDDPDFDEARAGWNGAIDRRPAAVAYAGDADDVAAAIRAARAPACRSPSAAAGTPPPGAPSATARSASTCAR
jgi:hypothetical protein